VRRQHASETAEDYVEAIHEIDVSRGAVRVADLSSRFGVSHVTVSRTLGRLQRDGLVECAPRRPVTLTSAGIALARRTRARHELVYAFLIAIGVDERVARLDAEGIEHHVSPGTLDAMSRELARKERANRDGHR